MEPVDTRIEKGLTKLRNFLPLLILFVSLGCGATSPPKTPTPVPSDIPVGSKVILICTQYCGLDTPINLAEKTGRSHIVQSYPDRTEAVVLEIATDPISADWVIYYKVKVGETTGWVSNVNMKLELVHLEAVASEEVIETNMETTKPMVTTNNTNINIRNGPGTDFQVVGTLAIGESLEIVGRNADSSWWQVNTVNGLGWVAASVTTVSNINDNIPVAEVVQPPTQEAPAEAITPLLTLEPALVPTPVQVTTSTCPNPGVQITSPAPGSRLDALIVTISGNANIPDFHHYRIEYSTNLGGGNWTYLFERDTPVDNGSLMDLNTSTVPSGAYGIRLTVVDQSGNYPEPCERWFTTLGKSCCRTCGANSKACGDSCISLDKQCHVGAGCACEG